MSELRDVSRAPASLTGGSKRTKHDELFAPSRLALDGAVDPNCGAHLHAATQSMGELNGSPSTPLNEKTPTFPPGPKTV